MSGELSPFLNEGNYVFCCQAIEKESHQQTVESSHGEAHDKEQSPLCSHNSAELALKTELVKEAEVTVPTSRRRPRRDGGTPTNVSSDRRRDVCSRETSKMDKRRNLPTRRSWKPNWSPDVHLHFWHRNRTAHVPFNRFV